VETFHNEVLLSSAFNREDTILISRINKHKELENAIKLPKVLGKNKIGKWMRIVGNMNYMQDLDYYLSLLEMVRRFDLKDYVTIDTNVIFIDFISAMRNPRYCNNHFPTQII
jgi:hypothetical protein